MKIFIDTANIEHIKTANNMGIIDGVTTNPTLVAREGKDFVPLIKEICSIVNGPISAEVIGLEQKNEVQRQQITELISRAAVLAQQQRAWRNQAIGISVTVSLLWIAGLAIWNIIMHLP